MVRFPHSELALVLFVSKTCVSTPRPVVLCPHLTYSQTPSRLAEVEATPCHLSTSYPVLGVPPAIAAMAPR